MFLKLDNLRKTREICNHPSSSFKVGKLQGHLNGYLIDSTWCGGSKESHSWARLESETSGAVSRRKKIMTDISVSPVHTHNITQLWFLVAFKPVLSLSNAESDLLLDKQPMLLRFLAFAVFPFSSVCACNPPILSCYKSTRRRTSTGEGIWDSSEFRLIGKQLIISIFFMRNLFSPSFCGFSALLLLLLLLLQEFHMTKSSRLNSNTFHFPT